MKYFKNIESWIRIAQLLLDLHTSDLSQIIWETPGNGADYPASLEGCKTSWILNFPIFSELPIFPEYIWQRLKFCVPTLPIM